MTFAFLMLTVFNTAGGRHLLAFLLSFVFCCRASAMLLPWSSGKSTSSPVNLTKESSLFKLEYGYSSGQWDQKGNLRKVPGKHFLALKMKQTRRNGWCLHVRALIWGSMRSTCFCGCRGAPGRQSPYSEESREENENNPDPSWWPVTGWANLEAIPFHYLGHCI